MASIGVIGVGLLSLAALLPVGQWTIFEATKADRGGACGRAAMRDVVVRRMLDYQHWYDPVKRQYVANPNYNSKQPWFDSNGNPQNLPAAFIIDPLGCLSGMNATLGNNNPPASWTTNVPRITLDYANTSAASDAIFRANDDLITSLPEEMSPPKPAGRPVPVMNGNAIQSQGSYSWFLTVVPTPNNPTRFTVSVVVCYRRNLDSASERAVNVTNFYDTSLLGGGSVAQGGGSVILDGHLNDANGTANGIYVKENNWVALCNSGVSASGVPVPLQCRWYRVVSISDDTSQPATQPEGKAQLTLAGPDWINPFPGTSANNDKLVAIGQEVIGVYTTTVDVDSDPTWKN